MKPMKPMTINERLKYAEAKRDEAIGNACNVYTITYWNGYIDALKAILNTPEVSR